MPYFDNLDTYINPYYLDVNPTVRGEMYARAQYYGARTKTGINSPIHQGLSNTIDWPYRKMPWATVTAKYFETTTDGTAKPKLIVLGFDTDRTKDSVITGREFLDKDGNLTYEPTTNSDKNGNLTLYETQGDYYESARNVPKYPLLTAIEISNEGQRGALLKGKFNFTFFPKMLPSGFELEAIQRIFFTPGNEVNIGFGWSISAFDTRVNKLEFTGIIYGFNWNFNQNTSITAEVQVVAPSTLAIGLSGEQTLFQTEPEEDKILKDPTDRPLPKETNILNIIQKDLRSKLDSGIQVSATGVVEFLPKKETASDRFNYFKIGLPTVIGSSFEDASAARLAMTAEERAQEQQDAVQAIVDAGTTTDEEGTSAAVFSGNTGASLEQSDISPNDEAGTGATTTPWNNQESAIKRPTASEQLFYFLREFESNQYQLKDAEGKTPAWLQGWINTYSKKSMGRYVWKPDYKDNGFKDGAWISNASLHGSYANMGSFTDGSDTFTFQISDLTVKDLNEFISKLAEKKSQEEQVLFIKRKMAQLASIELEELKIAALYHKIGNSDGRLGKKNTRLMQCFYLDKKTNEVGIDKYFWPDNLEFHISDATEGSPDRVIKLGQDLVDNGPIGVIKKSGKTGQDLLNDLQSPKNALDQRLNTLINYAIRFASNGKPVPKKGSKLGDGKGDDTGKTPKQAISDEEKQKLDKEISELKEFQSASSSADVFMPTDNQKKKDWIAKYPNEKFVGGIDVKTITDNWLVGVDYTGVPANLIAAKKSQTATAFVQKLIDAKEEQKKTGKDTAKDLLKIKSPAYQESLNNANAQNGGDTGGGVGGDTGGGSDGTGTDPGMTQQYQSHVIGQTYWYVTLKDLVEFANQELIKNFEEDNENLKFQKFRIQCENNEAEYQPDIKSAYPQNVYFPDISMGGYETFNPFYDNEYSDFLRTFHINDPDLKSLPIEQLGVNVKKNNDDLVRVEDDVINIGNILIGINLIIKVYRSFIIDNATNISYKNITNFFDQIIKEVNAASGDTYQLVSHIFTEPETLKPNQIIPEQIGESSKNKLAVLSIEDTHIARKHSQTVKADNTLYGDKFADDSAVIKLNDDIYSVTPFVFEATIFKPLIKNVSLSSKPPKELAFSAYIAARGRGANATSGDFRTNQLSGKAKPSSVDASLTQPIERNQAEYDKANEQNNKDKKTEEGEVGNVGFTQEWCDNYRTLLTKYKRLATKAPYSSNRSIGVGAQWLNRAIYPVDFTVTIDGINGFKFGDVLKTTMTPRHYNIDWDIVFTVTKILHKVTPSTWETTLNTAARLSLDSPLTGMSDRSDPIGIQKGTPGPRGEIYGPNPEENKR